MSGVTIKKLVKEFGPSRAVNELDLTIEQGEFVTLLGPSGCGKTTTLRCLAGLEVPTSGDISIGDQPASSGENSLFVPPDKRSIGMVFQSYALWPHMTVAGNVGYPLKLAKVSKSETKAKVDDMLARVHLEGRGDAMATSLSGGQQQRVALARAMINRPGLMLFDEPLSNLDAKLRQSMRAQIRELHDDMGTTSVYVTHDQEEAIALADRVVVMNAGRIEQLGTPQELYSRPESAFVADFMGFQNILPATVRSIVPGGITANVDGTSVVLRLADDRIWQVGSKIEVAFRAGHVSMKPGSSALDGEVVAHIRRATYLGSSFRVLVEIDGIQVRTQLDESEFAKFGPEDLDPGRDVTLHISPDHIVPLVHDERSKPADNVDLSAPRIAV